MSWNQQPGQLMTENVYNTDRSRVIEWRDHDGFIIAVDDRAVYDNWRHVDDAPQVRLKTGQEHGGFALLQDFVLTAETHLFRYGDQYHAGLCIVFDDHDVLIWGPHGWLDHSEHRSSDLRFRRPGGIDRWQRHRGTNAHIKLKRRGNVYSAWYSPDGVLWTEVGTTEIKRRPHYVGAILKTWGRPRSEMVEFSHFHVTHVLGEPRVGDVPRYAWETLYGAAGEAPQLRFIYDLAADPERHDLPLEVFIHQGNVSRHPFEDKLYVIAAMDRIVDELRNSPAPDVRLLSATCISVQMPPGEQTLKREQDRILIDVHEDYARDRFAAPSGSDDNFLLVGQSAGGQFVARFAMCHGRKLRRAVAASPYGLPFPTWLLNWGYGINVTDEHRRTNPRLRVDLESIRDLPLAIVHGQNDNLLNRAEEEHAAESIECVGYSRLDEGKKWIRQMVGSAGRAIEPRLYIVPRLAHGLTQQKTMTSLRYLLGGAAGLSLIDRWRYCFTLDDEDEERDVAPTDIPRNLIYYSKFDHYRLPDCIADRRYTFLDPSLCVRQDHNTDWIPYRLSCQVTHTDSMLRITIGDEVFGSPVGPKKFYGRLRLYNFDRSLMLQESGAVTRRFIDERVVGRVLYLFRCNERDASGPVLSAIAPSVPEPVAFRMVANGTVVDPATGQPFPNAAMMRTWHYHDIFSRLHFYDANRTLLELRVGEWRWGLDANGNEYVAGLQTTGEHRIDLRQLQTTPVFDPRHFEHWAFPSV